MTESEKLRRELKFIEDSYKSGIITQEEYEAARQRVEEKLTALPKEEKKPEPQPKVEEYYGPKEPEQKKEEVKEKVMETYGKKFTLPKKHLYLGFAALILLVIIIMFSMNVELPAEEEFIPACSADLNCQRSGFTGQCLNPGTEQAECVFEESIPVAVTVITAEDCVLCDTQRMKNTLTQIYPGARFTTIDESEALSLINEFDIEVLPAFVVDNDVQGTKRFDSTKTMFIEGIDFYYVKPTASGSSYFYKNSKDSEKVELFWNPSSLVSQKALENIQELALTKDFDLTIRYVVDEGSDEILRQICLRRDDMLLPYLNCMKDNDKEACFDNSISVRNCIEDEAEDLLEADLERADEFAINTVPVFIFNNQYKKGGSLSVDILDEVYCSINEC
ncbi:hypothetical protein GOV09_03010 [Candidatus Woesearchaeota archaeon]|nr:hypothetical protein [Candidatus Woesearchaeota archaeon]